MKKAVMYGAGNIGRGFIGQLLSMSGYEVVFLDINRAVINRLTEYGCYPLRLVSSDSTTETVVEHVRGVDSSDAASAAVEIASADVMATAVGANVLPRIAPVIAKGLTLRWKEGNTSPLNILICENLLDAHKVLEKLLLENLPAEYGVLLHERVGLVEASIGRMVPVPTADMQQGNPLRVWAEPYAELPVDKDGFRGTIPAIAGMKPFSPFAYFIERKLYMHNMSHSVLAYLGNIAGYEYIWQAARDEGIARVAREALTESSRALSRKYDVAMEQLDEFSDDLMGRFDNPPLGDTVLRVGRDPVRKLSPGDRLSGAAAMCLVQGILPGNICKGIAAALLFRLDDDAASLEISKSMKGKGLAETLARYCGIEQVSPLFPLISSMYSQYKHSDS